MTMESKSQSRPSSHIESSGNVSLGRWCDNERMTWGIKVCESQEAFNGQPIAKWAKTQPHASSHLDDDQITNADSKTLDRDRRIETPRRPSFPKRQPSNLIETSFRFLVVLGDDRSGERAVCCLLVLVVVEVVGSTSRSEGGSR